MDPLQLASRDHNVPKHIQQLFTEVEVASGRYQGPYAYATATVMTTPSKKCVYILLWNFTFIWNYPVYLSVLKLAPAEYATNAFNSKQKYEKLAVGVHVLQTTQNLVTSRCCFAEEGKEMYQELKRTCTAIVLLFKPIVW